MKKFILQDCINTATEKNGQCLSSSYSNAHADMEWQCENGHSWFAKFYSIKNAKTWCPYCHKTNTLGNIIECQKCAADHGGKCLSQHYTNSRTNMKWECEFGHTWNATFTNIKTHNTWCPTCSTNKQRYSLKECQSIAKSHGGKCISTIYTNIKSPLEWECSKGHRWHAVFSGIKHQDQWCPKCAFRGKTQKKLESIIQSLFPTYKVVSTFKGFDWLKTSDSGKKQEFDIWISHLKVAIEYDGEQHFSPMRFGNKDKMLQKFKRTKMLDRMKDLKVKQHPKDVLMLIRFNFKEKITKEYVASKLKSYGI